MKRPSILFLLIAALSAVLSLISCDGGFRRASMLSVLNEADSLNRNFLPLTNDTLLQEAVAYFDRHGSANERMRAYYLLGCAYRDKGQSPMAVDCYQDAIDCADTTSSDCDYRALSAVYSQMSEQYSKQLLFSYEIEARRKSGYYAQLDKDTLYYLFEKKMIAGCYILLNKKDSAELLLKEVLRQYEENGYVQEALLASNILMHLYIFVPDRQDTLKQLIDRFDANYALFDEHHELPPGKRMFYYYKGCYFENANQIDSAEHYYKKMEYSSMPYDSKVFLYNGLYRISQKRNNTDSIIKYSKLYCAANDTTVIAKDQELTAQLAASYNYTHFQKEAREKEREAYEMRQKQIVLLSASALIVSVLLITIYVVIIRKRHQIAELTAQYEIKIAQLEEAKQELENPDKFESKEENIKKFKNKQQELFDLLGIENNSISPIDLTKNEVYDRFKALSLHPQQSVTEQDWQDLYILFDKTIPDFFQKITHGRSITDKDKRLCMLIRMQFGVSDICNIMELYSQYVSTRRKQLLMKYFKINGKPEEFDQILLMIG